MQKIICFHNPDEINGFLSNWYPSRFIDENNITYTSMEQYMMYQKAVLFGDLKIAEKIIDIDNPAEIKALGRQVSGFKDGIWSKHKYNIVLKGVYLKFTQNPELKEKLLSYGGSECIFAECAVNDKVWGIGLSMKSPERFDKSCWLGKNLLGNALTETRDNLIEKSV